MSTVQVEREVVAPREVTEADVLEHAAYGYEEGLYDWHQGACYAPEGKAYCIGYALIVSADTLRTRADVMGNDHDKWADLLSVRSIPLWNDEPGRTKGEIVTALRTAAQKARES